MCSRPRLLAGGLAAALILAPVVSSGQEVPPPEPTAAGNTRLDPAHSRFGFELRTRWGQHIEGNFPDYEGSVTTLDDGRRQVRIRLASGTVQVSGPPRYARFASGPNFLDAARHPWVEFTSEPYEGELLRSGGRLRGTLNLHGVSHAETFSLQAATCARPAYDCDIVASGRVNRVDYGLETWRWAVQDEVRFTLRVRWLEEAR
jgi:polyisoprenoid-binding protein YceI